MADEEILEQNQTVEPDVTAASDDNVSAANEDLSPEELKAKLEEAEKKAAEYWDQLLRMKAEMENTRRRTQRDLENAHKYALEKFAVELLPVKDSLELGLQAVEQANGNIDNLRQGTELTLNMLSQAFEKFNLKELNPQGEKFNPEHHQAMSIQENAEVEANTVLAVMQKGYVLNDRLVRPAMVMVSKAAENKE